MRSIAHSFATLAPFGTVATPRVTRAAPSVGAMAAKRSPMRRCERGQSTVEYVGLVVARRGPARGARSPSPASARPAPDSPGRSLGAHRLRGRAATATGRREPRRSRPPTAPRSRRSSPTTPPTIFFEADDFVSLPVDFRRCRSRSCADTIRRGRRPRDSDRARAGRLHPRRRLPRRRPPPSATATTAPGRRRQPLPAVLALLPGQPDPRPRAARRLPPRRLGVAAGPDRTRRRGRRARQLPPRLQRRAAAGSAASAATPACGPRPAWEPWSGALHVAAGSHAGTTAPAIGDSRAIHARGPRADPGRAGRAATDGTELRGHARRG